MLDFSIANNNRIHFSLKSRVKFMVKLMVKQPSAELLFVKKRLMFVNVSLYRILMYHQIYIMYVRLMSELSKIRGSILLLLISQMTCSAMNDCP